MPDLPTGLKAWEQPQTLVLPTDRVIERYEKGFSGITLDPTEREMAEEVLRAESAFAYGSQVCDTFGFSDTAKGELIVPFVHVLDTYPTCWPGPGQERGDCVSHGQKNSNLGSMALEAVLGYPDSVTGYLEEAPKCSALAEKNGVLSTEAIYWFRGHGSDGWYCAASAKVSKGQAGAVLRQKYLDAGIDLTEYSGRLAGKFGASPPRGVIADAIDDHLFRETTEIDSQEVLRDLLARGFFVNTCGSEGLGKSRDENGVSRRSGSWAHSMTDIAVDDRPWAHQKYGDMLVLILNSWAKWNRGPRDIYDSAQYVPAAKKNDWVAKGIVSAQTGNILIPEGSCWVPFKDVRKRYRVAMGGCNGWKRRKLVDWLGGLK